MSFIESLLAFFRQLFQVDQNLDFDPGKTNRTVSRTPQPGERGDHVKALQLALNEEGFQLDPDGDFGPLTQAAVSKFQRDNGMNGSGIPGPKTMELLRLTIETPPQPSPQEKSKIPWFWALKTKHEGKHETNTAFQNYMNKFWVKTGLPHFKGLVGSARAWCGIFAAAGLIYAGYSFPDLSFRAISWDKMPNQINWKVDGIPQGAFVRINSRGDCKSASGNHIALANGDCAPQDLNKAGAIISLFGGNQGDMAKVSNYSVSRICTVSFPKEVPKPPRVTKSVNCSNGKTADQDSTR